MIWDVLVDFAKSLVIFVGVFWEIFFGGEGGESIESIAKARRECE